MKFRFYVVGFRMMGFLFWVFICLRSARKLENAALGRFIFVATVDYSYSKLKMYLFARLYKFQLAAFAHGRAAEDVCVTGFKS